MRLSLVTCTGARPEAFALCERWMRRQTAPWHQWIVVDDCLPITPTLCDQERVQPWPAWEPGRITLGRNLLAAFERVTGDAVVVIEDDDWYSPEYLRATSAALEQSPLVGEGFARYYNVRTRGYIEQPNYQHASLSSTAWRHDLTPRIADIIKATNEPWYDIRLWHALRGIGRVLSSRLVVSIKGMPGRGGIGVGHHAGACRVRDPQCLKLREWIGDDAEVYEQYWR